MPSSSVGMGKCGQELREKAKDLKCKKVNKKVNCEGTWQDRAILHSPAIDDDCNGLVSGRRRRWRRGLALPGQAQGWRGT